MTPQVHNRSIVDQFTKQAVPFSKKTAMSSDAIFKLMLEMCEVTPQDTVLDIFVTPEVEMKFSKLKIDKDKYTQTRSAHLLTVISYSNDDEGIIYAVDDDEVTDITYVPSKTDCQELIKKGASNNPKIQKAKLAREEPQAIRQRQGARGCVEPLAAHDRADAGKHVRRPPSRQLRSPAGF
jgi:hypothetical protein